jgi:hypothetical protein
MRRLRAVPVVLAVAVLGAAGAHAAFSSHTAVSPTMHAFVHEDQSIGLTFDDGTPIGSQARTPPSIPPGTYTIRVVDDASTHNFHIHGPGVDVSTGVGDIASPTWTVTFQPGSSYQFLCDEHPDFMYGNFTTTGDSQGGGASGGTSGGSASGGTTGGSSSSSGGSVSTGTGTHATLAGTLIGHVNAAGKLTLTDAGARVAKLGAGRYKITVVDTSRKRSFVVQAAGRPATTVSGVAFVGTHSVTVNLTAGRWTFFSSAGAKSTSPFTVTA